ncbi:hypothetical protein DPMN_063760 [Dreissena polymorpha]|uniref:Uncharacterized protein n=1 Tax=Dreissena polymorpha TaxID=45954 RepID=A0A9D4CB41_DREPO|nr:hypothetical protein DPMN_063760 [Dreissena polymorpha]
MTKLRQEPVRQEKERSLTKESMKKARQKPERPEKERLMTNESMRKARQVPEKPEKERSLTKESMRKARQNPDRPEKERLITKESMRKARQVPGRPEKERSMTKNSIRKARQNPERPEKERLMTKESKRKARQVPGRPEKQRSMTKESMRKCRLIPKYRDKDKQKTLLSMKNRRKSELYRVGKRLKKQSRRVDLAYKSQEKLHNKNSRRSKRALLNVHLKEKYNRKAGTLGNNISSCINKFKSIIADGQVFVCTCCHQTWFKHSVMKTNTLNGKISASVMKEFFTGHLSFDNCEWVCNTCIKYVKKRTKFHVCLSRIRMHSR